MKTLYGSGHNKEYHEEREEAVKVIVVTIYPIELVSNR